MAMLALLLSLSVYGSPPTRIETVKNYYVLVCAESEDEVSLLKFDGEALSVERTTAVGSFPADIEGPHGINVSPDGRHFYVSISHGRPYGSIHKYETESGDWVTDVTVGMFPATLAISPRTGLLYVVNFNLYGKMEPSSISVVDTASMTEVAQVATGIMPHGGRFGRDYRMYYSVNMMQDQLVELDAHTFKLTRSLDLGEPVKTGHGMGHGKPVEPGTDHGHDQLLQPTWVTSPTPAQRVYVAANNRAAILEVDLASWKVTRRFQHTGKGPYNMDVTADGRSLMVTYKKDKAVGIWDLKTGTERARIETLRRVPHGVVISPDGRFGFVTVEGIGGEPGSVEVYDLAKASRVAHAEIGKQAGGIAFWKEGP